MNVRFDSFLHLNHTAIYCVNCFILQIGFEEAAVPFVPGGRDFPVQSYLWYVADSK